MNEYGAETQAIVDALGNQLTRAHALSLAASTISSDVARLRGYRSVAATNARTTLCIGYHFAIEQAQRGAGLLIPLHGVSGGQPQAALFKPDNLSSGHKYERAAHAPMQLDVPPICQPDLSKSDTPKFITLSVKQADAVAVRGHAADSRGLAHASGIRRAQRGANLDDALVWRGKCLRMRPGKGCFRGVRAAGGETGPFRRR